MADSEEAKLPCDRFSPAAFRRKLCRNCFLALDKHSPEARERKPSQEKKAKKVPVPGSLGVDDAVTAKGSAPIVHGQGASNHQSPSLVRSIEKTKPPPPTPAKKPKSTKTVEVKAGDLNSTNGSIEEDTPHRTVLLIGKTGNGKSTLANVLAGTHLTESKEELFKESHSVASETMNAQLIPVKVPKSKSGKFYRYDVVDTIGIGDTALPAEEVMLCLARACNLVRSGFHQIFFVTKDRFTEDEEDAFNIMRNILFSPDVWRFITIVRTNCAFFKKQDRVEKDIKEMTTSPGLRELGRQILTVGVGCAKIIHVDNPNDDHDNWVEMRTKSRHLLLTHLERCDELYYPDQLKKIEDRVTVHVEEGNHLKRDMEERRRHFQEQKEQLEKAAKEMVESASRQAKQADEQLQKLEDEAKKRELEHKEAIAKMESEFTRQQAEDDHQRNKEVLDEQRQFLLEQMEKQQEFYLRQQKAQQREQEKQQLLFEAELARMELEKNEADEKVQERLAEIWQENLRQQQDEAERRLREANESQRAEIEELKKMVKETQGMGVFAFIKKKWFGR